MPKRATENVSFPPEITDRILDFLHGDVHALRNCSLTCRAWLPRSRFHLFSTMELLRQPSRLESFCAFLQSSPYISPYIEELTIDVITPEDVSTHFPQILNCLHHLKVLRFYARTEMRVIEDDYTSLSLLHTLQVHGPFATCDDLIIFLRFAPNVENLYLIAPYCRSATDSSRFSIDDLPRMPLKTLSLLGTRVFPPIITRWLTSCSVCLSALSVTVLRQDDITVLNNLLEAVGGILVELELTAPVSVDDHAIAVDYVPFADKVSTCTSLRNLRLLVGAEIPQIISTLSQVTQNVTSITLRLDIPDGDLALSSMRTVAEVLSEARFRHLQRMFIVFYLPVTTPPAEPTADRALIADVVNTCFARLTERAVQLEWSACRYRS
ncbi:hypothetical protein CERSUDRAFT_119983 [Gelatoporia subvermispora B]|uniref:F-box domain-containing protein n=1 Tax=Ceriporiopsis subvermispora (strain B) TaxID=914234 RepID=M2QXB1_CERS8|nr:hypothetical protein CERSUDRAFT_119983 [Gelatoporia subvermispora B]